VSKSLSGDFKGFGAKIFSRVILALLRASEKEIKKCDSWEVVFSGEISIKSPGLERD
jgi:hypothetical protein